MQAPFRFSWPRRFPSWTCKITLANRCRARSQWCAAHESSFWGALCPPAIAHCANTDIGSPCFDPKELREWMPNYGYGAHAFGLPNFQSLIENRETVLPWIKAYSPIEHVSADDPPIAMFYGGEAPVVGSSPKDPTHSGVMGVKLEERLKAVDVDVVLVHPERPHPLYKNSTDYLIDRLTR